tara:strand:- start:6374 stop:6643 length:270 start_codon:yes stop_codon:yes gene_type:complete
MEIIKSRYGIERTVEKLDSNRIRVMGESLITRGSEDVDGNQTMFDFEGGPCLNVGGTIRYFGTDFKILSIKSEKTKLENVSSVLLEVTY